MRPTLVLIIALAVSAGAIGPLEDAPVPGEPPAAVAAPPPARAAQSYYPTPGESAPATPPARSLRLISPFPVVRIVGRLTARGARIRVLSVRAPTTATIIVTCRRRGCRRRSAKSGRGPGTAVRFRRFERWMRAGTLIEVTVGRSDRIGKFTRFRIRRGRAPARKDLCLMPGASVGTPCPVE